MTKHSVVIAGGGPTGLVLAGELALAGIDVVVVERRETQELAGSRAGGLHARTIEVLDQRGIAERFVSAGKVMQVASFVGVPLDISDFPTRHPYGLAIWQNQIERILAAWVRELPVTMIRGRDVTAFTQNDTDVDITLSDGTSLRAAYLVGCDGGRSVVRKGAGIDFPGWDASTSYLIAEFATTETPPAGIRRTEKGMFAIGPLDDGRTRAVLEDAKAETEEPTAEDLRAALFTAYGTDFGAHEATWISRFSDMARQAASYRSGRVLVAGDAAHVHSPKGGQGLNIGVQDAVNLGWKLAQVVRGVSPGDLLDTYHAERHPIGACVLRTTLAQTAADRMDARSEALRDSMAEMLRIDAVRKRYAGMMSGLDIRYDLRDEHALVGRRMPDLELADGRRTFSLLHEARPIFLNLGAPGSFDIGPWANRVRCVDAHYEGTWELPVLGVISAPVAVLIRPDGYVAWVSEGTEKGLREALTRWFGRA